MQCYNICYSLRGICHIRMVTTWQMKPMATEICGFSLRKPSSGERFSKIKCSSRKLIHKCNRANNERRTLKIRFTKVILSKTRKLRITLVQHGETYLILVKRYLKTSCRRTTETVSVLHTVLTFRRSVVSSTTVLIANLLNTYLAMDNWIFA